MIPEYYEFFCSVKIISGKKALSNLPYEMGLLGAKKAMIITDQGVVGAGLMEYVKSAFEGATQEISVIFDQTPIDSSVKVVNELAVLYRGKECDCIIAVGGGSCLDTAKGVNIVISEGNDDLMVFQGMDRLAATPKPFIAIPTTAGTGSEVTAAAVIADTERGVKMPFISHKIFPQVAILDPRMTLTMPPRITAATGMDALTHAIEAYYDLQKNPISDSFALTAIRLVNKYLISAVKNGSDEQARLAMANAALCAGIAFSNSMVGIVHGLAHATGGCCHVPHGVANSIYLPWGMEYNLEKRHEIIAELAPYFGVTAGSDARTAASGVIRAVRDMRRELNDICKLPLTLKDAGVDETKLELIAKNSLNDGSMTYNPEEVTYEDALAVLKKAWDKE